MCTIIRNALLHRRAMCHRLTRRCSSSVAHAPDCNDAMAAVSDPGIFSSIHSPPVVRRPGEIIDIAKLIKDHWSHPGRRMPYFQHSLTAVGFNSILEMPLYVFEEEGTLAEPRRFVKVPNDIFGLPLRPDILHRCYMFCRRAKAGYSEDMQLYKWEWPGSTKKWRKQQKAGRARIGWKKSPGKYLGVFAHPVRPGDQRTKIQRRGGYLVPIFIRSSSVERPKDHVVRKIRPIANTTCGFILNEIAQNQICSQASEENTW